MRNKCIPYTRTVEEEIKWLDNLGLNAEEKISILELMISTSSPEDQQLMSETIETIRIEKYLLGVEDK
jgi:hypothetical protein